MDTQTLRAISSGAALDSAQTLARSNRQLAWRLVRTIKPPKIMSVRVAALDHDGKHQAGQVVVKFDTEQASLGFGLGRSSFPPPVIPWYTARGDHRILGSE